MGVYPIPDLKTRIDTYINTNGIKAITGPVLNSILKDVIDSLNEYTDDELTAVVADLITNTALTTALGNYLLKSGGTMSGNLDMQSFQLLVNQIKAAAGLLYFINAGNNALINDITALSTNRTITWRNLAGTPAFLDDIKNITVVLSTTPASHTGDIDETVKFTESIPANTFTTHDKINKEILASAIGSSGTKTIKCYVNTTPDLVGTPVLISVYSTNHLNYSLLSSFFVDSDSSMKSYKKGNFNSSSFSGSSDSVFGTFAINWTIQQYLVVTVKLANSADLIQLEGIFLNRSRK